MASVLNRCLLVKFLGLASFVGTLVSSVGAAAAPQPRPPVALEARLIAAFSRTDVTELERVARRLGIAGLRSALLSRDSSLLGAALAASPLSPWSWQLLPHVVVALRSSDPTIASRAALSALQIAEDLRAPDLEDHEDWPALLGPWARRLATFGADQTLPPETRATVVLALAQMAELVPPAEDEVRTLLSDPEPAVRRAAVELLAHSPERVAARWLAGIVAGDRSPRVARAAAAVLCAGLPRARRSPGDGLRALRAAGAEQRLRQMTEALDASPDELLDIARCLSRLGTPEDRRAIESVRQRSPLLRRQLSRALP